MILDRFKLDGKKALVTGAGWRIGRFSKNLRYITIVR